MYEYLHLEEVRTGRIGDPSQRHGWLVDAIAGACAAVGGSAAAAIARRAADASDTDRIKRTIALAEDPAANASAAATVQN